MNVRASLTQELISEARLEKALSYLASTDEKSARLKTDVARKEYLLELARKKGFLLAEGNIEERKAHSETSKDVQDAHEAYLDALLEHERVKARRVTEALIIETWRSVKANRRVGNI
jgi:DNA-binding GntR family transcriptional regulator